jgi:hypothetical protein
MFIPDLIFENLASVFRLKYFNSFMRIRDIKPGSGINIPDPQHWIKEACGYLPINKKN